MTTLKKSETEKDLNDFIETLKKVSHPDVDISELTTYEQITKKIGENKIQLPKTDLVSDLKQNHRKKY